MKRSVLILSILITNSYSFAQQNHVRSLKDLTICQFPDFSKSENAIDWNKINRDILNKRDAYGVPNTADLSFCSIMPYGESRIYFFPKVVLTPTKNGITGMLINISGIVFANKLYSDRYLVEWSDSKLVLLGEDKQQNQIAAQIAVGELIDEIVADYKRNKAP